MAQQRALNGLAHCDDMASFSQYLDEPAWPSFTVFQEFLFSNIDWQSVLLEPTLCEPYPWNQRSTQPYISLLTWTRAFSCFYFGNLSWINMNNSQKTDRIWKKKRLKPMHVHTSSVLQVFLDHPLSVFVRSLQTQRDVNTPWISYSSDC